MSMSVYECPCMSLYANPNGVVGEGGRLGFNGDIGIIFSLVEQQQRTALVSAFVSVGGCRMPGRAELGMAVYLTPRFWQKQGFGGNRQGHGGASGGTLGLPCSLYCLHGPADDVLCACNNPTICPPHNTSHPSQPTLTLHCSPDDRPGSTPNGATTKNVF